MRDNGSITLRGEVLDVTHKSGTAKSGNPYAFDVVSVLTGKSVSEVTWPSENAELGPCPKEGDKIAVEVDLGTYAGRLQIEPTRLASPGGARLAPTGS